MLHTKTCNRLLIIQLLFFSSKAGKAKRIKKRSARSRSLKQVFLQYKVTNCTMSYNTCTLFARIYTLLCCRIIVKSLEYALQGTINSTFIPICFVAEVVLFLSEQTRKKIATNNYLHIQFTFW